MPPLLNPSIDGDEITASNTSKADIYLKTFDKSEFFSKEKTRTQETERFYAQLWNRIMQGLEYISDETIYDYYLEKSQTVAPSTFRLLKAVAAFALSGPNEESALLLKRIQSIPLKKDTKREKVGPAKKRKNLSERDFAILINYLASLKTDIARQTILYCQSTIITGLRPSEWMTASIIDSGLHIINGKNSNGRACGDSRVLAFSSNPEFATRQREILTQFIDIIPKTNKNDFDAFMRRIYRCLRRASNRVLGAKKTICLYTLRHQFSANIKRISGKGAVAIAMGHRSDKTAGLHYAKSRYAWMQYSLLMTTKHKNENIQKD